MNETSAVLSSPRLIETLLLCSLFSSPLLSIPPWLTFVLCVFSRFLALLTSWTRGSVSVALLPSLWLQPSLHGHDGQLLSSSPGPSPVHHAEVQRGEERCVSHSRLFLESVCF